MARPRPRAPPVTTARRPRREISSASGDAETSGIGMVRFLFRVEVLGTETDTIRKRVIGRRATTVVDAPCGPSSASGDATRFGVLGIAQCGLLRSDAALNLDHLRAVKLVAPHGEQSRHPPEDRKPEEQR